MTHTAPTGFAALFVVVSIFAVDSAAAGEVKLDQIPQVLAENFPPVVTNEPTTGSSEFPPVVGGDATGEKSSGAGQDFPPVEHSSTSPSGDPPPVEPGKSNDSTSSSSSTSGSTSGSHKKHKDSREDSDFGEEHHEGHGKLRRETKRALKQFLQDHGGFISNFSRSRHD